MSSVCHVEDVVVDEEYRNMKLGKKLLNFAAEYSRLHCCYKTILNCADDVKIFYEKNGYQCVNNQMAMYHIAD